MTLFSEDRLEAPLRVTLEVTGKCNLSCKYCYRRECETSTPSFEILKRIIRELEDLSIFDVTIAGGEPFLNKKIVEILNYAAGKDLNLSIVTNGTLMSPHLVRSLENLELVEALQLSIDSHIESIHDSVRGGFLQTMESIKIIKKYSQVSPIMGSVLHKQNIKSFKNTLDFFSDFFERFHVMNIMGSERALKHRDLLYLKPEVFSRYWIELRDWLKQTNLKVDIVDDPKEKELETACFNGCTAARTAVAITSELEVIPCDIVRNLSLGSIRNKSLKEIWNSKEVTSYRFSTKIGCSKIQDNWFCDSQLMSTKNKEV